MFWDQYFFFEKDNKSKKKGEGKIGKNSESVPFRHS